MTEDFEEQNLEFDPQAYLAILRRRHLHFLIPVLVGWLVVWGASWILRDRYKSTTLILVEQPTMPKDYVTPNISDNLQERLGSITQQILSRTNLLHIIDEFNLYSGEHGHQTTSDEKVERMRKDVEIELVRDMHNQVTAFNVSYSNPNPRVAQQVTSEITNLFINENLEVRQQQSEDTTKFLTDQLETARKTLAEQEQKKREFEAQHVGELPQQLSSNLQILQGLQAQLQSEEDALNTSKQQRVYLETLLSQYRSLQDSPKSSNGASTGLPAIDVELEKLRAELADLSARYTERHPDVRKLKDQIAQTEQMRDQLIADLKAKASSPNSDDSTAINPDEPQSPATAQLQSQMKANQIEIANRERSIQTLKEKVADYQARLSREPVAEQQLAELTRGYDQLKANYDDLLKKKNESAMATSMELLQQGERFRMLDPPSLPLKADFPNRMKFCGIGLGVGLALGVLVAGAFEVLDDRIYDEKKLQSLLPTAVISELPEIASVQDLEQRRRKVWLGWATAALVFGTILAGSALSFLRG
jgi:polysaccharide biosynthesis transport protein